MRILGTARALLQERGAGDVSMAQIAKGAGVSRQAVYLHFGSRGGLFVALVQWIDEGIDLPARIAWCDEAAESEELLERLVRVHAEVSEQISWVAAAIRKAAETDEDARAAWEDRMDSRLRGFTGVARRISAEGRLRTDIDVGTAADLLVMLFAWETWWALVEGRGWSRARYERELTRIVKGAVLRGGGEKSG